MDDTNTQLPQDTASSATPLSVEQEPVLDIPAILSTMPEESGKEEKASSSEQQIGASHKEHASLPISADFSKLLSPTETTVEVPQDLETIGVKSVSDPATQIVQNHPPQEVSLAKESTPITLEPSVLVSSSMDHQKAVGIIKKMHGHVRDSVVWLANLFLKEEKHEHIRGEDQSHVH